MYACVHEQATLPDHLFDQNTCFCPSRTNIPPVSTLLHMQGNKEAAQKLICLAVSELDHLVPPVTQKRSARHQTTLSSTPEPAASSSSADHPFSRARACLTQAKLINSRNRTATSSITLAGCGDSFAQRRLSHNLATTSQGSETHKAGTKGSRASRPSRAVKSTGRGARSTRSTATLEEDDSQNQLDAGEDIAKERSAMLQQAELLLQGYHVSHGHPLLHRWDISPCLQHAHIWCARAGVLARSKNSV